MTRVPVLEKVANPRESKGGEGVQLLLWIQVARRDGCRCLSHLPGYGVNWEFGLVSGGDSQVFVITFAVFGSITAS